MSDEKQPSMPHHILGGSSRRSWRVNEQEAILAADPDAGRLLRCEAAPQNLQIDLKRTAIIVIDMQNDFCHADGWLASIGVDIASARTPIAPLQALLPRLREVDVPVIWLNWGNRPDRMNLSPSILHVYKPAGVGTGLGDPLANGARVLEEGSWAAAVVDELAIAPEDICVSKYRMSGFWDTPLDSILRNLRVDTVLFAGVNVDQCVLATLIDANCLGYDCVLLSDCSATTSPTFCTEATYYNVKQCFGFVTKSEAILVGCDTTERMEP
jgi:nicotinamidase-related amidase